MPCQPSSGAVAAVHGAEVRYEKEYSVRVSMGYVPYRRVSVFSQGIDHVIRCRYQFFGCGNSLSSNGACGIIRRHQGQVVRCDGHAKPGEAFFDALFFFTCQVKDAL